MNSITQKVTFVVKTSKLCNLRCQYCYEFAELGNKAAISLEQAEKMFRNIASYYSQFDFPIEIEFNWHGGETLLQPPKFYWNAFQLQRETFKNSGVSVINSVQTNLTVLDSKRLTLLKNGFDRIGVSIDLFGSLRLTQKGNSSQPRVLENMDRLRQEGIPFGCITVLTQRNLPYLREMYDFYRQMNIPFRILPLFKGAFEGQHDGFEITPHDTLEAYCQLIDFWLEDEQFVSVTPLMDYIRQVIHLYTPNALPRMYNKKEWEFIYLVNTTGDIYSVADAYNIERSHGNIFTSPLGELVKSDRHLQVIAEAEDRIAKTCFKCPYYGSCSGFPIGEGSRQYYQLEADDAMQCIVEKGVLQHIEYRLIQAGILNLETRSLNLEKLNIPQENAAVAVPV